MKNLRKTYPVDQLRDYSSLFTRSEVNRVLDNDLSVINKKIKRYDERLLYKDISYLNYYRYVYKVIGHHYPNEYIYKNEFINKWVKEELGKSDSIILNELRIGGAIADLAMFNGTSKVFEIKTSLDKEDRLSGQIKEYQKIFNEIYLIVPHTCVEKFVSYDKSIGIISFDEGNRSFDLVRKSDTCLILDKSVVMKVLHTHEYKDIVKLYYGFLPKMTDFTQFQICHEYINRIPSNTLNHFFVETIKKRKINNLFFNKLNNELNQVCLSLNLDKDNRIRLVNNLNTKISL